jgi:hypothetical protein
MSSCWLSKNENLSLSEAWSKTQEKLVFFYGFMFLISWRG